MAPTARIEPETTKYKAVTLANTPRRLEIEVPSSTNDEIGL